VAASVNEYLASTESPPNNNNKTPNGKSSPSIEQFLDWDEEDDEGDLDE